MDERTQDLRIPAPQCLVVLSLAVPRTVLDCTSLVVFSLALLSIGVLSLAVLSLAVLFLGVPSLAMLFISPLSLSLLA